MIVEYYLLQKAWEEGLKAVDRAIWVMPRAIYRDLVQYKLIFKCRLGRGVESEMVKVQVSILP